MKVLVFGEVLWDIYPHKSVIGGAPLNFCAHLSALGTDAYMMSAVGDDPLGEDTLEYVNEKNLNSYYIGRSANSTGVCKVSIDSNGVPSYDLSRQTAYDDIKLSEQIYSAVAREDFDAFYFGTLAQREICSRETLRRLLRENNWKHRIFDINIRQDYYSRCVLLHGLELCTILKASREEAGVFEELGLTSCKAAEYSCQMEYLKALCRDLTHTYGVETVLLTLDEDGAMVFKAKCARFFLSQKPTGKVVSTVGAGDSFSAAYLHFALHGTPVESCLRSAVILSDYVVEHLESAPAYSPELLEKLGYT